MDPLARSSAAARSDSNMTACTLLQTEIQITSARWFRTSYSGTFEISINHGGLKYIAAADCAILLCTTTYGTAGRL